MPNVNEPKTGFLFALAAVLALGAAAERGARAGDPTIEVYDADRSSGFSGGGIGAGVEVSTFPSPDFIVAVDFRGISNHTGDIRYFMVSGKITFNEGTHYVDSRETPDAPFIDVDIVPVSNLMSLGHSADGHSATSGRWLPTQIHRDIKLADELSISVHAWGIAHDAEAPLWQSNPAIRGFIHAAVDLIGYRYMLRGISGGLFRPDDYPADHFHGFELATAQAELGLKWDLSRKVQLRLSLGGTVNAAVVGQGAHTSGASVTTESDFFTRLEVAFTRLRDTFSVYVAPGVRVLTGDPVSGDALTSYNYIQVGIRGTFQ